ncbi:ankyrin repeat domain-containing protein [Orientia tsutsugamushi]|uniref:Uncharacterized protein n=1 Tax=Orientia tsutsugamushi TaxID=784 RepID=A0A2U3QUQ3_ORITS|nr:ankyrin repeat domain-containing protein [Orientia tsutsugamushi]KJV88777.1 ankyrin repeats family protein [Orientia tsutsugamushi str. UT76]QES96331.1 ankyrin repeat domain-containing protein [Orientia tsutsugamushi]SPR04658.1 Uncharacterised protein [Orientia tsutsugamushi]
MYQQQNAEEDDNIRLIQELIELIKHHQYSQARTLMLTRYHGELFTEELALRAVPSMQKEELDSLLEEFMYFCENVENCRNCSAYETFFDGYLIISEIQYCSRIALELFEQGKLFDQKKARVFLGGMDVVPLVTSIAAHHNILLHTDIMPLMDILIDYAINTNLKYQHRNNSSDEFEAAKMALCTQFLSMIGITANVGMDDGIEKRIACILENSANSKALLNFNKSEMNTLMFNLIHQDCTKSARLLFDRGLDINYTQPGCVATLLDVAIERNNICVARLLLQHGVEMVDKHHSLFPEMGALCNTYQFFRNTGYFKDHKLIPDQMLEDSLEISSFITQDKSLRDSCWPALKRSVNSETLLSQMAYEFRCDKSLLPYFIELTQLELSELQLQSAASDADNKECSSTTHRDKYTARKSSPSTTDRGLK